jgi:hypothetical protein
VPVVLIDLPSWIVKAGQAVKVDIACRSDET